MIADDICCRELLEVRLEDGRLGLEVAGLVSNANYNVKRAVFLLFINSQSSVHVHVDNSLNCRVNKAYLHHSVAVLPSAILKFCC